MSRRYREILNIILNTEGCITGNELAKQCDVSVRTIRLDIKEINDLLKEYDIKIDSIVKKGYYLTKACKELLKEKDIIRSVLDHEYIVKGPNTPIERQMYILLKLTMRDYISVEELADKLYISTSTVNSDINSAKKWLKENLNLSISYSLSKGIKLNCGEKDKRNIISWIIGKKSNASTTIKIWSYLFGDKDITNHTDRLFQTLENEIKQYGYILSGHSSQLLYNEIVVAHRRYELGFNLEEKDKLDDEFLPVINVLREKIKAEFQWTLPDIEWLYLQRYFMSKQFINGTDLKNIETTEAINIVDKFLKNIHIKFNIYFTSYPQIKDNLLLYVAPMINRLRFRYCIDNSIDENIVQSYPLEFQMATEMLNVIKEDLNLNVNLLELAYITMHLVSTNEIWSKKINTIMVCDYDESIIMYIKNKIFKRFSEKIKFCGFYTYREFVFEKAENLEKIDLIITTATLANKTNIPLINISPTIEQEDIVNLYEDLKQLSKSIR